jgi:23S rRNA (guanosine2251-2'-O)-methyltransferase
MIRKKTGPSRPEKRTAYGKSEGRKSDRPDKRVAYGKSEGKRERPGSASWERRSRRPLSARPAPVVKERRHEIGRHEEKPHEVIYGVNPVLEAFRAGRGIEKVILAEGRGGKEVEEIIGRARSRNVKVLFEPREALTRMARTEAHQGVVAVVSAGRYSTLEEIMDNARASGEPPFVLILDCIQDPQNLGAIIRSAVCAGVHGIIIPKDRAVGLTSAVEKASAGGLEYMKVAKVTNIAHTLEELKREGLWIIGTDSEAKGNIYSADFKGPVGLVIGSEGEGIRPLVARSCDLLVSIPLRGKITSLNASAATAVLLYEVVRQRGRKP